MNNTTSVCTEYHISTTNNHYYITIVGAKMEIGENNTNIEYWTIATCLYLFPKWNKFHPKMFHIFFIVCRSVLFIYSNEIVYDGAFCNSISVIVIAQLFCSFSSQIQFTMFDDAEIEDGKANRKWKRRKKNCIFITLQLLFYGGTNYCRLLSFIMFPCFCKNHFLRKWISGAHPITLRFTFSNY